MDINFLIWFISPCNEPNNKPHPLRRKHKHKNKKVVLCDFREKGSVSATEYKSTFESKEIEF